MSVSETERWMAEHEARERTFREWAERNQDTPLGRVASALIAEDDTAADLTGGEGPDYYSGLGFALNRAMDEVLGEMPAYPSRTVTPPS